MTSLVRRVAPSFGLLALLLVLVGPGVQAQVTWCKRDPEVLIGGKRAHVYVSSLEEIVTEATGPTKVRFVVPEGIDHELIRTDEGFGGRGYDVRFVESDDLRETSRGIPIKVQVRVPASSDLPVLVEVTDGAETVLQEGSGDTNEWITVKAKL